MNHWFNRLPPGWVDAPLKTRLARNDGGVWGDDPEGGETDTVVLRSTEQRVDGSWNIESPALRKLSEAEASGCRLEVGDLVVTKSSGSESHIGKTSLVTPAVAALHACYSNFMQRLRVDTRTDPRFVHYWMNNELCREQFAYLSNSTSGLANLNGTVLGTARLAFPALHEQERIANFLDEQTARIDALIAEKEQLVERMAELRYSTVTWAVTGGLGARGGTWETGHPFIPTLPVGWQLGGLTKYIGPVVDYRGKTPEKVEDGVLLVTARNIRDGVLDYEASAEYVRSDAYEEIMRRGRPTIGDVLFTTEAPLGQVANIDREDIALAQRVVKFRGLPGVLNNYFLKYWLMGDVAQSTLATLATGSTAEGIKASKLGQIPVALPPLGKV
jgi:type I restriction enzyme S subunit